MVKCSATWLEHTMRQTFLFQPNKIILRDSVELFIKCSIHFQHSSPPGGMAIPWDWYLERAAGRPLQWPCALIETMVDAVQHTFIFRLEQMRGMLLFSVQASTC